MRGAGGNRSQPGVASTSTSSGRPAGPLVGGRSNPYGDGRAAERIADRIALELVGDDRHARRAALRRDDEAVPVELSA